MFKFIKLDLIFFFLSIRLNIDIDILIIRGIDLTQKPICPYCEKKLTQLPTKKSKCKECNNFIYPRKHFQTKKVILLKDDELTKYDKDKSDFYFIKKWKTTLKSLGITEKQYEKMKKKIKLPFEKDVIWSIFNQIIIDRSRKPKPDFHELKMIYLSMALFLNEQGENPFNCLKSVRENELISLKQWSNNVKK